MTAGSFANIGSDCSTDEDGIATSLGLTPGSIVVSKERSYVLEKLLGEGGFGAVFKVRDKDHEKQKYALKVEARQARQHNKLKMEIDILKRVSQARGGSSHFTKIVDYGKHKELYVFVVMELVGRSLSDLKDLCKDRIFPLATGLSVSKQCLEALQDLHAQKYLHRDLKPANYAVGRGSKRRQIFLLDFGIARRFVNGDGQLKTPRATVNFKGTVRFASLNCHRNVEMGCKDDCESWFYLMLDLIVRGGLPWKRLEAKADVLKSKEECRNEKKDKLVKGLSCGDLLHGILKYIDSLKYEDGIDYDYIYHELDQAATLSNVNMSDPYPWENSADEKYATRTDER